MTPTPAAATQEAFTAVAWSPAPLPAAALRALTGYAMAAPADRISLRSALLRRPDTPEALVDRLLGGPLTAQTPLGVRISWLLRPERTAAQMRAALHLAPAVQRNVAAEPAAGSELLAAVAEQLTPLTDPQGVTAAALLRNAAATDPTRLAALTHLDAVAHHHDPDIRSIGLGAAGLAHLTTAVRDAVPDPLATAAAGVLTHPYLLAHLAGRRLPEPVQRHIIDVCLTDELAHRRLDEDAAAAVLTGLAGAAEEPLRRHAVAVLHAAGVEQLAGTPIGDLAGLADDPRLTALSWVDVALGADRDDEDAAALAAALTDALGEDPGAWQALTVLAPTFGGTVTELLAAATGIATCDRPAD